VRFAKQLSVPLLPMYRIFHVIFILSLLLITGFSATAQQGRPGGSPPGMPKIGVISGVVLEDTTAKPIPFASVAALRLPDSTLAGGVMTDEKGRFKIEELGFGNYILRVTMVGFRTRVVPAGRLTPENIQLQNISVRMKSSTSRLKEVTIVADEPEFINSIDKKVYNVDKSLVSTGGTVTDVLQNIPSVSVDIDGKVALRGSENVTILIDGKPSGMLGNDRRAVLRQIPASAIDQIEVITNPSAKYDAEGMAGIINIKTKKDKFQGTNGSVAVGVGTNDKYNLSLSGNDRTAKRNIYANYGFRHENRFNYGSGEQFNYLPGQDEYSWITSNNSDNTGKTQNGKVGIDFYLSPQNTLGLNAGFSVRTEDRPEFVEYNFFDPNGIPYDSLPHPPFFKQNNSEDYNKNFDASIDYKHNWIKNKGEFSSSVSYSRNDRHEDGLFGNSLLDVDGVPFQASLNDGLFQTMVAQADFSWPFKKIGKLESGVKSTLRQVDNDQSISYYQESSGTYLEDPLFSDVFSYDEQVLAAYSMFSGKWSKFEYNAGLRAEQTLVSVYSKQADNTFDNDYLKFFPSVFIKYNLKSKQEVQFSYSRRINRPDSRQLNPFTDFSDSLSIRTGNPYLQPELINSFEVSYARNWEGGSFTSSVYRRHTDDLISRYRSVDTTSGIAILTSVNFSSSDNTGWENILRIQVGKLGSVMASFNIFQNVINADNINAELQSDATQWSGRLNMNAKLTSTTSLQITANYVSVMKSPVGEVRGMSGVDAAVRQDFWKGKGTLTLNVSDIFFTRKFRVYNFSDFHTYNGERVRESRIGMLTFSYRFGKNDTTQRRRGKPGEQRMGGDQPMEMMDF